MIFRPLKALIFSALAASMLLSACQGSTAAPTLTPAPTQPDPLPTQAAVIPTATLVPTATSQPADGLKGLSVTFWHPWQGDLAKRAGDLVDDFNRHNEWGISVMARPFYNTSALEDALDEVWQQNSANVPAVIAAPSDLLAAWSETGRISDLKHYLDQPEHGLSAEQVHDFNPLYWSQDQSGGQQLGLPALRSAQVIFYNKTWASELGFIAPPATSEQFREQACAASKANNQSRFLDMRGTGGYLVDTDALSTLSWLTAFGANVVPSNASSTYAFVSPQAKNALTYLRKMFDDGCAWVGRSPTPSAYFEKRMALFYSGTLEDLLDQQRIQEMSKSKDQWSVLPFPGEGGKPVLYASGYSYAVTKSDAAGAKDTGLAAWLFIRWMAQPENASRLVEGMPSLPVSQGVQAALQSKAGQFPWDHILPLASGSADAVRPAPGLASWRQVRRLLEDGMHQVYYQPVEQMDQVLPLLDQMVQEVLKK